jgi:hypothetical protein
MRVGFYLLIILKCLIDFFVNGFTSFKIAWKLFAATRFSLSFGVDLVEDNSEDWANFRRSTAVSIPVLAPDRILARHQVK